jgi:hypothetical protein
VAFLSRCFAGYARRLFDLAQKLRKHREDRVSYVKGAIAAQLLGNDLGDNLQSVRKAEELWNRARKDGLLPTPLPDVLKKPAAEIPLRRLHTLMGELASPHPEKPGMARYLDYLEDIQSNPELADELPHVKLAMSLLCGPYNRRDGVPVLLSTKDTDAKRLADEIWRWLSRSDPAIGDLERAVKYHIRRHTICRRLEIHDIPSSVLIHILQRNVEAAQRLIFHDRVPHRADSRFKDSWRIRLVIDDFSIIRKTYLEVSEDPLVLPFLLFYLRREGITSLFIDTQNGRPDITPPDPMERSLRTLIDHHLYTWRFPFYGENRIAITALPPASREQRAVVRELKEFRDPAGGNTRESRFGRKDSLVDVDPHFELYTGIEERKPQPVPLEVRLYAETGAFKRYINEENTRYRELFQPVARQSDAPPNVITNVITSMDPEENEALRDFCYLQRDTRLEHTLVFQVDEFWALRRPGMRRAGAFAPQDTYLNSVTTEAGRINRAVDPFGVFQPARHEKPQRPQSRRHFFRNSGYQNKDLTGDPALDNSIDRIPFIWDFGFLLCRSNLWESYGREDERIGSVWKGLPKIMRGAVQPQRPAQRPGWREFLEACYHIATRLSSITGEPVQAFDLSSVAPASFSCLILEIWASEIDDSLPSPEKKAFRKHVRQRTWRMPQESRTQSVRPPGRTAEEDATERDGLIDWLEEYDKELFRTWLLLVEVLNISQLAELARKGGLSGKLADTSAVAARYWYKTASQAADSFCPDDPLVPVGLPGHFSVRGDWFLAVSGGSRSPRLGDRALDLLSSRRSNFTRLKEGMGLPTRDIEDESIDPNDDYLPTRVVTVGKRHSPHRVTYPDLCLLGARNDRGPSNFNWFWRSRLGHYARHARVWQDWLNETILWWDLMRKASVDLMLKTTVEADPSKLWVNGFDRYDRLDNNPREWETLQVWRDFRAHVKSLRTRLLNATPIQ